jgi:hypothetical protein
MRHVTALGEQTAGVVDGAGQSSRVEKLEAGVAMLDVSADRLDYTLMVLADMRM